MPSGYWLRPQRGDQLVFRGRDGLLRAGVVTGVQGWTDVVESCRTEIAALDWGAEQRSRFGEQWQHLFWRADVVVDSDRHYVVEVTDVVEIAGVCPPLER